MKKIVVFVMSMMIAILTTGQGQSIYGRQNIIDPEFSGINVFGTEKIYGCLNDYLRTFIQYPRQSLLCSYQGTEVVRFKITTKGNIEDISVVNSVCPAMDEEVIRVLKYTDGKWIPGRINGEPVAMEKEISVCFKIKGTCDFLTMARNYMVMGNTYLYEKNNPQRALQYFNDGLKLLPYNESLLIARILCKTELGDIEGANRDQKRLDELKTRTQDNAITVLAP